MTTLNVEIPEKLINQIQILAVKNNQTIGETVIQLLNLALPKSQLKLTISEENDPTWEQRRREIPQVLA